MSEPKIVFKYLNQNVGIVYSIAQRQALTLIDSKTGVSISIAGTEVDLLRQILNEGIVK
jgi:hypothetical protein